MQNIYEYITLAIEKRQQHLKLDEACIERGAGSYYFKGLLAHLLDTTVPTGHKIHLCHACNNSACGNPNHLYWGTASENAIDRMENGDRTIWEKMVEKYGYEEACKMNSKGKTGNTYGSGNKGKPKSDEHKAKISANHKGGRKKKLVENADVAK
jgi:hypothetical protein